MEYQHIVNQVTSGVIQTPAYIFDIDVLRDRVSQINKILGSTAKMCYAIKANPFIIRAVDDLVPKYEVCSPGELEICRNSHIPMEKVVFSGVNKTATSVRIAAQYGVGVMTIESLHQFDLIAECAAALKKEIRIILRLTNGSQFGINEEDIEDLISRRSEFPYIHMLGVQYFTGTQKKKCDNIIHELDYAEEFCARLMKKYDYQMEQFEYGTGLWVPYFTKESFENQYADITRIRDYFAEKKYPYQVILEMGRYPVASCGLFATKVEDAKTNKGTNFCLIDAGIHQINYYGQNMALKTPIIDHYPMHPVAADAETKEWTMVGSLCTFNDVVARNFPVKDLQIGDYFMFHNIGAYSVTEGGYLFLSRDLPNIYFADEENGIRLVRQGIPTHILSTPDMSTRRLDKPVKKIAEPQPTVAPMARQTTATVTAKAPETLSASAVAKASAAAASGAAVAKMSASQAPTGTPRAPKRFVPETDVVSEIKSEGRANTASRSSAHSSTGARSAAPAAGNVSRSSTGHTANASGQRSNRQNEGSRRASSRRKKKVSVLPFIIAALVLVIAIAVGAGVYLSRRVLPTLSVEAGTSISTADLMRYKSDKKKNNYALPHVDTNTPGEYNVDVYLSPKTYHATVTVTDTVAPTLRVQDLEIWCGTQVDLDDFVVETKDATQLTLAFDKEPDVYTCGEQELTITCTDLGDNKTTKTVILTVSGIRDELAVNLGSETLPTADQFLAEEFLAVLADQGITADQITFLEEPVIDTTVPGDYPVQIMAGDQILSSKIVIGDAEAPIVAADDIYVTVGGSVAYKKAVRAYDNVDASDALAIEITRDGVDLNTEGEYTYTATVTDAAGNTASDTGIIHVLAADAAVASIDEVNDMADDVLATIVKDGMTKKEIIKAIYDWIRKNTRYTTYDQESDYVLGAYDGFTDHAGNCFTYAAMAKYLLTRAGIDNIDIVKVVPEDSTDIPTHFWNLVNIGDGWYHYDVTPRKDGSTFFYITDAKLREYSDNHNYTHRYDESLYPEIQ